MYCFISLKEILPSFFSSIFNSMIWTHVFYFWLDPQCTSLLYLCFMSLLHLYAVILNCLSFIQPRTYSHSGLWLLSIFNQDAIFINFLLLLNNRLEIWNPLAWYRQIGDIILLFFNNILRFPYPLFFILPVKLLSCPLSQPHFLHVLSRLQYHHLSILLYSYEFSRQIQLPPTRL